MVFTMDCKSILQESGSLCLWPCGYKLWSNDLEWCCKSDCQWENEKALVYSIHAYPAGGWHITEIIWLCSRTQKPYSNHLYDKILVKTCSIIVHKKDFEIGQILLTALVCSYNPEWNLKHDLKNPNNILYAYLPELFCIMYKCVYMNIPFVITPLYTK